MKIPVSCYGWAVKLLNLFVPVREKEWIFGADYGNMYREGSKYMLEYMLKEHPDYKCTFITRRTSVKQELDKLNIPCEMNFSCRGIITIARASVVFFCQASTDIMFIYRKPNRRFYYLIHGQPIKLILKSLDNSYKKKFLKNYSGIKGSILSLFNYLNNGTTVFDSDFVSATSEYMAPFIRQDLGGDVPVKILGMPRNDALFQPDRYKHEKWVSGLEGKLIIMYMPTHRNYGKGELSPIPFVGRSDINQWMEENNVVLLVKQHPNMIPKLKEVINTNTIKDISKLGIDPQTCIYKSDVLISDYSSVWIDYLLLKRPIIFYFYDNYETEDCGVHFDIREDPAGPFCYSEDELFEIIKAIHYDYKSMCPSERIVKKFHQYVDGNSCERHYKEICCS